MWSKVCVTILFLCHTPLFFGCTSAEKSANAKESFRAVLARENYKLHQDLSSQGDNRFTHLDLPQYYVLMEAQSPALAKEIKSFSKVELGHTNQVFVICVSNESPLIAICDNSSTAFVDRVKVTPIESLSALMDEIRGP